MFDREVELLDRVDGFRFRREIHDLGLAHVSAGEPFDGRGDRRAEQQGLALLRAAAEDFFDVGTEADIEHAIGFVEHDDFNRSQVQRPAADEIDHAARRADDDVGTAL